MVAVRFLLLTIFLTAFALCLSPQSDAADCNTELSWFADNNRQEITSLKNHPYPNSKVKVRDFASGVGIINISVETSAGGSALFLYNQILHAKPIYLLLRRLIL